MSSLHPSKNPGDIPLSIYNYNDQDDASTLHSDHPTNSSRVHLVHQMDHHYKETRPATPSDDGQEHRGRAQVRDKTRPAGSRHSSWDMLGGVRAHDFEGFDFKTATAREEHLRFAEGDFATDPVGRFYNYLLNLSIVTRWFLYIVPVLGLLWIPGILNLTAFKDATLAGKSLLLWSIWFTIVWAGWWGAFGAAKILPFLVRGTIGVVAVSLRKYIDFLVVLERYIAFFGYSMAVWISFTTLLQTNSTSPSMPYIGNALKAVFFSAVILLAEKLAIQYIALSFHQTSYADRIIESKVQTRFLVTLYRNSSNIPGRLDTLNDDQSTMNQRSLNPRKVLKDFLKGMRSVAETTTTALGNVATEITGSSILQPNSPEGRVSTALGSANKTRLLARRLYYSFRSEGSKVMTLNDIARYFPDFDTAQAAFSMFDKDGNGDASRDEIEMACMEVHRERLSLAASLKNIDSAVGRLDAILTYVWLAVAIVILVVCLDSSIQTSITATGSFVLGLSWLIGSTATEVLASIIFLFMKHPYDCGDRVNIDAYQFTVKEIQLLSTIFMTVDGRSVQVSHNILNTKYIENVRRSGQMSELFTFEVAYETTFEQLEQLRAKMLSFVTSERRDFQPVFDVVVQDIPDQTKMVLNAYIRYKSNWQQVALQAQRHNKWVCALRESLRDVKIYGPGGAGDPAPPPPPPQQITLVPWEEARPPITPVSATSPRPASMSEPLVPKGNWNLSDRNAVLRDDLRDVFGVSDELQSSTARSTRPNTPIGTNPSTRPNSPGDPRGIRTHRPPVPTMPVRFQTDQTEEIEMRGRPSVGSN